MINRAKFAEVWAHLCTRFNRANDAHQAAAYHEFLSEQMDTPAFVAAARAIWVSNTYFPSPAEFVMVQAQGDWPLVLDCAKGFHPPDWPWVAHWRQLSPRGQAACKHLGGMDVVRALYEKDVTKLKANFERAFSETLQTDALQPALPKAPEARRISAGSVGLTRLVVDDATGKFSRPDEDAA